MNTQVILSRRCRYRPIAVLLFLLVLFVTAPANAKADEKAQYQKILFVGNSFSFYQNGIHNQFSALIRGAGQWDKDKHRVRLLSLSGGHIAEQLAAITDNVSADARAWDTVVLQGHSTEPYAKTKRGAFESSMKKAVAQVRGAGAEPVFFMTWAYKDQPDMTDPLASAYLDLGKQLGVKVVPVGLAFAEAQKVMPQVEFFVADILGREETADGPRLTYRRDWKHPSEAGSYLAACIFYASFYQQSPENSIYYAGLAPEVARTIQAFSWRFITTYRAQYGND